MRLTRGTTCRDSCDVHPVTSIVIVVDGYDYCDQDFTTLSDPQERPVADRLTDANRWTIAGDDVELTTGVVHTAEGPLVFLALENTATMRPVTGRYAPIQADGWLTADDVDALIARLLAAKQALNEANGR